MHTVDYHDVVIGKYLEILANLCRTPLLKPAPTIQTGLFLSGIGLYAGVWVRRSAIFDRL